MGDLFGSYRSVGAEKRNRSFESVSAYEEHYMKLLKKYLNEINEIEEMMRNLRKERQDFYMKQLPAIKKAMVEDDVLSADCKAQWLTELQNNMERSFQISESLIQHYITKNLEEFKQALKDEVNKV
ncbi:MAG: hypothetical protein K2G36_02685 [Ruminococcus sp.]|nr:hypothetical protein [Ruminococcus sp.]